MASRPDILERLHAGGFVAPGAEPALERWTGGVSSDVAPSVAERLR